MSVRTLAEIRDNVRTTSRESTSINDTIDEYINLTLMEINDPAWATGGYNHNWSFNKRKHTFSTADTIEDYNLPRDIDKISLVRQETSPTRLVQVPDDIFYFYVPDPTATGNPTYYRLWEEEGLSTSLAADGTIDVISSSSSDTSQTVSVVGYDTNGIKQSETYTLNGAAKVTGSKTFDAGRVIRVSKSAATTGNITVTAGATTLLVMGPEERSPRFKVISLYPIPSATITMYLEYYTRIRRLVNAEDVPDIDEKWIWVVRTGALAKVYQYQGAEKQQVFLATQGMYAAGVASMVKADMMTPDYVPYLRSHAALRGNIVRFPHDSSHYGYNYGLMY